jgi:hypothetical protein
MADIYTHILASDSVLHTLTASLKKTMENHKNIFYLGAQGPDIFFYHRIFPWYKKSKLKGIGDTIHSENINDFFVKGLDQIGSMPSSDKKTLIISYFFGFMTHYAVDIHTHPFIFYHSGHEGGYNHKYYEVFIDTCMAIESDFKFAPTHKKIKINKLEKTIIADFLESLLNEVFAIKGVSENIKECISDMSLVLSLLYDKHHIKKPYLRKIDDFTHSNGKIKTAIFPMKLETSMDYLNKNHKKWFHPCKPHVASEASFEDLLEESVLFAKDLIEGANRYLKEATSQEALIKKIGNKAYDTGLDLSLDQTMTLSKKLVDYEK